MAAVDAVNFMRAQIGDTCSVYVDVAELTEHYCVFDLVWFDERDGPITLRHQRWTLMSEEQLVLP